MAGNLLTNERVLAVAQNSCRDRQNSTAATAFHGRLWQEARMLLGASLTLFGLSAGSIVFLGHTVPPNLLDMLAATGVISAFVAICSAEATLAS